MRRFRTPHRRASRRRASALASALLGTMLVASTAVARQGEPATDPPVASEPILPSWVQVAPDVEPHVRSALALALEALPEPLRTIHESIRIERAVSPLVPDDAPLSVRLLGRAALMLYSTRPPTITVFDGAVDGGPTWGQPAPDARSLGAFLNDLTDVLGIAPGSNRAAGDGDGDGGRDGEWDGEWLENAWGAFVARVHRLDPERRRRNLADPTRPPALGDPATLDIFLQAGVRVALGGLDPSAPNALVGLFVHELGHAIQFGPCMDTHLRRWGELSGWRTGPNAADPRSERAAGRHAGMLMNEDPIVLIRLILGDRRRGVLYDARCLHCFPTLYGKYDMAEDFAEAVRLMAHDPARLASSAPEKLLFVNAVGFNRTMDHRRPTPLWRDLDEIRDSRWGEHLVGALATMLTEPDMATHGPRLDARTVTALVGAHAALLDAESLPPPHRFPTMPTDMPRSVFRDAERADLTMLVGDVEHLPPPSAVIDLWAQAYLNRRSYAEFEQTLAQALGTPESLREQYLERVRDETDREERTHRFLILLPALRKHLSAEEYRRLVTDEMEHAMGMGRGAAARWIAIESRLDDLPAPMSEDGSEFERRELAFAHARRAIEREEFDLRLGSPIETWKKVVQNVQAGDPAGSLRRIELLLMLAERFYDGSPGSNKVGSTAGPAAGDHRDHGQDASVERPRDAEADPDDDGAAAQAELAQKRSRIRSGFIEAARRELDGITWPRIRREAERRIADAAE